MKTEMNKFHEVELEKSFDLIQTTQTLRTQVSTFFATVNLGALSLGITQSKTVLFFFAAGLFWIMIIIDYGLASILAHAYYRVIYLHKLYVKGDPTFSPHMYSGLAQKIAQNVRNVRNEKELMGSITRVKNSPFKSLLGFWLPILASLVEIALGLYLRLVLGWDLF